MCYTGSFGVHRLLQTMKVAIWNRNDGMVLIAKLVAEVLLRLFVEKGYTRGGRKSGELRYPQALQAE